VIFHYSFEQTVYLEVGCEGESRVSSLVHAFKTLLY